MALVVTIGGVNRTAVLEADSIRIQQVADQISFTAELSIFDVGSAIAITAGSHKVADEITVVDGATTYFGGFVANQEIETAEDGSRHLALQCQGYGILLNEVYVEYEDYFATADDAIIDDLFDTYLAVIDSVTHVAQIDNSLSLSFTEMTLAECLSALCQRTQGRWYVDNSKKLHYFADEGNDAGFDLSDEPNDVTSFPYHAYPKKSVDAAAIVNRVRVIGADDYAVVRNDGDSQALYGIRAAIVTDHVLTTTTMMNERGDGVLDKNKDPRITYVVRTFHDGAVAGNEIDFKCDELDYNSISNGDDPLVIREMNIFWAQGRPVYEMTLGSHADISAITRAAYTADSIRKVIVSPNIPLASLGWGHDVVFSATDYRTVIWAAGDLTLSGGMGSYGIALGTTGNMAAVTYIFLDVDVSPNVLQLTDTAANAIGSRKILIAVAAPVADADTNKAIFQVFGGEGAGVFIVADNIAANTISANEMAVNSIVAASIVASAVTSDKINAGAVTAGKILAGAVTADKLSVGSTFFNKADGLLLLDTQHIIKDTNNYLVGSRKKRAQVGGALHVEQGRWMGKQGLVIEVAMTNRVNNPSFEVNVTDSWTELGAPAAVARDTTKKVYGSASCKITAGAGGAGIYGDAYNLADDATITMSAWVWAADHTHAQLHVYHIGVAGVGSVTATKDSEWERLVVTYKNETGGAINVTPYLRNGAADGATHIWADAVQSEVSGVATTYTDGTLGDGYAWTGAVHNSDSTRAVSYVLLNDHVALISGKNTLSFRLVAQMPYDADATWPREFDDNYIFEAKGADSNNRIILVYDETTDKFEVFINGGWRLASAAQIFKAGDWMDIVLTLDFGSNDHNLYVSGTLEDNDTTAMTAPTLTQWTLGAAIDETLQPGVVVAEYAVFSRVLTAIEVAQLFNLQRPLVDMYGSEKPGIYILDGQFRIQSSQTGNRIEMTPGGFKIFEGATEELRLYGGGLKIKGGVSSLNNVWWADSIDVPYSTIAQIYGEADGGHYATLWIMARRDTGDAWDTGCQVNILAIDSDTGVTTTLAVTSLRGVDVGGTWIQLTERADPAAPAANEARLYCRDVGGKTELCVRFETGLVQRIAIQP